MRQNPSPRGRLTNIGIASVTIVVLAGGRAARLPNKLALPVDGEPMLLRVCRRLTGGARPLIVCVREPPDAALAETIGGKFVVDAYGDAGPLGALASAAAHVRTPLFFAAAGDVPDINASFVDALESAHRAANARLEHPAAVLPTWADGEIEPLAALYDTVAFLHGAQIALNRGLRKVTAALEGLAVLAFALRPEDQRRLANINTPADYARVAGTRTRHEQ